MRLKKYTLTAEPLGYAKLLVKICRDEIQLAHAVIPVEMWDNKEDLDEIIKGVEHMKKKRIGAAFFNGKGGSNVQILN